MSNFIKIRGHTLRADGLVIKYIKYQNLLDMTHLAYGRVGFREIRDGYYNFVLTVF